MKFSKVLSLPKFVKSVSILFTLLVFSVLSCFGNEQIDDAIQIKLDRNINDPSELLLTWPSKLSHVYFVQKSNDLVNWSWHNFHLAEEAKIVQKNVSIIEDRAFFRLQYTEFSATNTSPLLTGDFDNDSISNYDEISTYSIMGGLDPLNPDTDGDGIEDEIDPNPLDYQLVQMPLEFPIIAPELSRLILYFDSSSFGEMTTSIKVYRNGIEEMGNALLQEDDFVYLLYRNDFVDGQPVHFTAEATLFDGRKTQAHIVVVWGQDQDTDGLEDSWEQIIANFDSGDAVNSIAEVFPSDDFDLDFVSNYVEQIEISSPTSNAQTDTDADGFNDSLERFVGTIVGNGIILQ